jgi:hypothetical protein
LNAPQIVDPGPPGRVMPQRDAAVCAAVAIRDRQPSSIAAARGPNGSLAERTSIKFAESSG